MKNIHAKILALLTLLSLCAHAQTPPAPADATAAGAIRVACVGDSITFGSGSTNPYPKQLGEMLGAGYSVKNFGVSGRTLLKKGDHPYWIEKAFTDAKAFQPNIVVIMLGTNDTKVQNWVHFDEFYADYKDLVETFKNLDSKPKIFVCRPCPVFGAGNYHINETNLKQEMPLIDKLAAEEGAGTIDMHAALIDHQFLEPDFVHPNAAGDTIMAQTVADALKGTAPKP